MSQLSGLAKLGAALLKMEAEPDVYGLSRNEKDVLYAFGSVAHGSQFVSTDRVKSAPVLAKMPHATFHRAMKRLLEAGFVEHAPNSKAKHYQLGGW